MALIIEDGTLVPNANSYVTDDEALAYLTARNMQAKWLAIATTSEREAKLVEGADYLNGLIWKGVPFDRDQTMALPTSEVDYIPNKVKYAQILLAVEAIDGPLQPAGSAAVVTKLHEKLEGVGETETTYADNAPLTSGRSFPFLAGLLGPFINSGTSGAAIQTARRYLG